MIAYLSRLAKGLLRPVWWRVRRSLFPPRFPLNTDGTVRLHLGCGPIEAAGYVNIDLRSSPNIHFIHDVCSLEMFGNDSIDLIYASHVLEHLPVPEAKRALADWHRVLKQNGVLRLAVPDFSVMVKMYTEGVDLDIISGPLLGAQNYRENCHKAVYDESHLKRLMQSAGFGEITRWDPATVSGHDFEDASSKVYEIAGKRYPISLNLEGAKR